MNIVLKALTTSITSDQKYSSSSSSSSSSSTALSTTSTTTASSIPTPTIVSKDVKPRVGVSTRRSSSLHTNNNNDKNNSSKDIISKVSSNNRNYNNNSSHDEILRMINQMNNDDKLQSQIMSLLKQEKNLTHIFNDCHPIHFNNTNNASCSSGSSSSSSCGDCNSSSLSSGVKRKHITVDDKNISNYSFMNESKSDLTTTASRTGVNTSTATTMTASITNQRYHHNDVTTQQAYTNNILTMSNKENISHLFQNRNINNIISGNSTFDCGENKFKSSLSPPLKTIPRNLKDQIINIKNKSILHSINDINNNNNKWIKPKIDDNDHDKQDMRSIIEKRMVALRKFLDVDQDNVTTTDTLDITGFTGFF
jgi:hypothetical protein